MKTLILLLGALAGTLASASPGTAVIAEWDFNSPDSTAASTGRGEFRLLGGVIATNFQGSAADPGSPNSAISLRAFPAQAAAARSAGLEFSVSARGWKDLALRFEIRASATANRWVRLLVNSDGGASIDAGVLEIARDGVFTEGLFDLTPHASLADAAQINLQLVSDVGDQGEYVGVKPKSDGANSYSSAGTWRLDRVALLGTPLAESPPELPLTISRSEDQWTLSWPQLEGTSFTVWRSSALTGPWSVAREASDDATYRETMADEPRYFRVTAP